MNMIWECQYGHEHTSIDAVAAAAWSKPEDVCRVRRHRSRHPDSGNCTRSRTCVTSPAYKNARGPPGGTVYDVELYKSIPNSVRYRLHGRLLEYTRTTFWYRFFSLYNLHSYTREYQSLKHPFKPNALSERQVYYARKSALVSVTIHYTVCASCVRHIAITNPQYRWK